MRSRRDVRLDMLQPAFKELRKGDLRRLDILAGTHIRDQAGAFDLRLSLGALKAVPLAFPLTGSRIALVQNNRPMARATFADMALHSFHPTVYQLLPRL